MANPSDEPLIQGLAEGRQEAFAALYDRFGAALFRVACVLLASRHDAEDAVQEVFVGLVRARRMLPRVENLRAYVFTALRSAAAKVALARDKQRRALLPDPSQVVAPAPQEVEIDLSVRLERALLQLPAEQRELVSLKVDAGLTFAEIASCLGINSNTAASRYRYAIEKLRAAVEGTSDEPSRTAP